MSFGGGFGGFGQNNQQQSGSTFGGGFGASNNNTNTGTFPQSSAIPSIQLSHASLLSLVQASELPTPAAASVQTTIPLVVVSLAAETSRPTPVALVAQVRHRSGH